MSWRNDETVLASKEETDTVRELLKKIFKVAEDYSDQYTYYALTEAMAYSISCFIPKPVRSALLDAQKKQILMRAEYFDDYRKDEKPN